MIGYSIEFMWNHCGIRGRFPGGIAYCEIHGGSHGRIPGEVSG